MIESELHSIKTHFHCKGYNENWSRRIFVIESASKSNPWTYKIQDLNGEKVIGSFCEKKKNDFEQIINELLLSRVRSHIRDKVKVVIDLSSYLTKKVLEHATALIHLI